MSTFTAATMSRKVRFKIHGVIAKITFQFLSVESRFLHIASRLRINVYGPKLFFLSFIVFTFLVLCLSFLTLCVHFVAFKHNFFLYFLVLLFFLFIFYSYFIIFLFTLMLLITREIDTLFAPSTCFTLQIRNQRKVGLSWQNSEPEDDIVADNRARISTYKDTLNRGGKCRY